MGSQSTVSGPDLAAGIDESALGEQPLVGHVGDQAVLLVRHGQAIRAIGATCTHYGGPLAEGIVGDGEIRCPWHHACFDLATGQPRGPAIAPLPCWDVVIDAGRIRVGAPRVDTPAAIAAPRRVVIVGGGAAGVACAEALRAAGHQGSITIVSAEGSDPVDRPNLSKDYLAGAAPEEWVFLRTADALREQNITVVAGTATKIDTEKRVVVADTHDLAWDALVIATGCEPIRLPLPGADQPHVLTLRSLADSRAIAAAATAGGPVVIIGASFIGLEVAASLRARGVEVTVVGPETTPLARVLGDEVGAFVRRVHEAKGVRFELGRKPASIGADHVVLDDGRQLPARVVVMGVGVRPRTQLAAAAGLTVDNGIVVDAELRAAPGVWAAGDVARFPWQGDPVRIEHWQVAVRHGQHVARAMLGQPSRPDTPFFWSQHHDVTLGYVGHAERITAIEIHGDLDARDAHVVYRTDGAIKAVMTIGRDQLALRVDAAMERGSSDELEAIVR
jgi:NADPH-dependent 2,4-dienoyl-CoA reductase/sulfur reductase-like enzyme/nitrite reductase/ring-hydroxylating ferredoxin subunit